jgi:phosphate transport system protein
MERRFQSELKGIKDQILAMAGMVEQAIGLAIEALLRRNAAQLQEVYAIEKKINQAHIDIDNQCLGVLARQAPVAVDLRLILAITKINTDLERMGDQAVNLAHNTEHYLRSGGALESAKSIEQMASVVKVMVREALDAFVNSDVERAKHVLASDDTVDEFKSRLSRGFTEQMKAEPAKVEQLLNLILITRNLERMGDHATNIAEDTIFVRTGQDIRHGAGRVSDASSSAGENKND